MKRKITPGHGFWIISDYGYGKQNPGARCSACGMISPTPVGNYCRWCGTHMDQESLILTFESHDDIDECTN